VLGVVAGLGCGIPPEIRPGARLLGRRHRRGLLRRRGGDLDLAYVERWLPELQVGEQWGAARRLAEGLR